VVKITTRAILIGFLGIGLLAGERVSAQQAKLIQWDDPVEEAEASESTETPATRILEDTESPASYESVVEDGELFGGASGAAGCEICGGGNSGPPSWYLEEGVRIMTRSSPREMLVTKEFASEDDPLTVATSSSDDGIDIPHWVGSNATGFVWDDSHTESDVMKTTDLVFDMTAGYTLTLGHHLGRDAKNRDHFVEFTYWGSNAWNESAITLGVLQPINDTSRVFPNTLGDVIRTPPTFEPVGPIGTPRVLDVNGSLRSPFKGTDERLLIAGSVPEELTETEAALARSFNVAEEHSMFYRSRIDNFELNGRLRPRAGRDRLVLLPNGKWRRECTPGASISYLFGMRFISINESFAFRARGRWISPRYESNVPNPDGSFTILEYLETSLAGDYLISTHNDLVGPQIGFDYMQRHCKWNWGVRAKAGPMLNLADQSSSIRTAGLDFGSSAPSDWVHDEPIDIQGSGRSRKVALVGEVGFMGAYKIFPNLTLHAGYDFTWVTGLALAPEQLVFSADPPNGIKRNGSIFYQGLTMSMEWLW